LVDGHLPEDTVGVEVVTPVAASAVDAAVFTPSEPSEGPVESKDQTSEHSADHHYFDTAPIPGVDVTLTSDGSHRSRN